MILPMLELIESRFTQVSTEYLPMFTSKATNYQLAPFNLSLSGIETSCTDVRK